MGTAFDELREQIARDPSNSAFAALGYEPLFVADPAATLVVIGHAPGRKAQEAGVAWGDASGARLIEWLGIDEPTFRDPAQIALIPMDFYYQGKGASGDLPPRRDFAPRWHPPLFARMPRVGLFLLVGSYAQAHYLGHTRKRNLTETVRAYAEYLPRYFPIVHPSPLNFRWLGKNPWFERDVVPALRERVATALAD